MKVIDEKGRLFGKLNIIDLLVIVLIVAAIVVVGIKVIGDRIEENASQTPTTNETPEKPEVKPDEKPKVELYNLTYTVRVNAQTEQLANFVARYVDPAADKKDQVMMGGKLIDAYVVDFWTEPTRYNRLCTSTGAVEVYTEEQAEEAGLIDICFVIEASGINPLTNLVGTQEVRVGQHHAVKTTHFEFYVGTIEDCVWEAQ